MMTPFFSKVAIAVFKLPASTPCFFQKSDAQALAAPKRAASGEVASSHAVRLRVFKANAVAVPF